VKLPRMLNIFCTFII